MRHPLDDLLTELLAPAEVYAVGGRVRDELRAERDGSLLEPKDLDFVVCGLPVAELTQRLATAGRVDVVGASFAVIKFSHPAGQADIAVPRRERSTGVGHRDFAVEAGPDVSLSDDLRRRDFRMNMIARRTSDGVLIDPYDGMRDIAARRIDIVSDATFVEDPLRMLRAAQFSARFDFAVSDRTQHAMTEAAHLARTISAERIGDEFAKLLALAPAPSAGFELLRATGVLRYVWPELLEGVGVEQNEWHAYDVYRHNLVTMDAVPPGDLVLRLAALLHDVAKPRTKDGPHFYRHEQVGADLVPHLLERLRFSRAVVEAVAHLVRQHMYGADPELSPKALRRFIQRIGPGHLGRLFALRAADIVGSGLPKRDDANERFQARVYAIVAQAPAAGVQDLAINGRDVLALLEQRGETSSAHGDRRVGPILRVLFEHVIDEPAFNERSTLLAAAAELVSKLS